MLCTSDSSISLSLAVIIRHLSFILSRLMSNAFLPSHRIVPLISQDILACVVGNQDLLLTPKV